MANESFRSALEIAAPNETAAASNVTDVDLQPSKTLPLHILLPSAVMVTAVVMVAVGGNLLVIASYCVDPRLRTVSNVYLLHLAVCDLLIGAFSMPVYMVYTALKWQWPFGRVFCKVWLTVDHTLCAQSVFLVILISFDQLLILRDAGSYFDAETKVKAYVRVTMAWVVSFLLYGPAIILWDLFSGKSQFENSNVCLAEFFQNKAYVLSAETIDFVIPVVALTSLNAAVYWEIRKRIKVGTCASASSLRVEDPKSNINNEGESTADKVEITADPVTVGHQSSFYSGYISSNTMRSTMFSTFHAFASQSSNFARRVKFGHRLVFIKAKGPVRKQASIKRGKKDLKPALFTFVFAFLICWSPKSIAAMVMVLCKGGCIVPFAYEFFTWLLWFKSVINPFLYAANNCLFKLNFSKIFRSINLCCRETCSEIHSFLCEVV